MNDIGKISIHDGPFFYGDDPIKNQALGNTTSIESDVFDLANTQAALKILIYATEGEATLADTKTIKAELLGCDTEDGEFSAFDSVTLTGAASSGTEIAADETTPLMRFIPPPDAPKYGKLKITTDSDVSAVKVTAKIGYIAR